MLLEQYGFIGNIWVRQHFLAQAGDSHGGHAHYHDHITLLVSGSVQVQIDDTEPKIFKAPTFIVIKKEHRHKFTALEDETIYYCVFAVRDVYGEVIDIADVENIPNYPAHFKPSFAAEAPEGFWETSENTDLFA